MQERNEIVADWPRRKERITELNLVRAAPLKPMANYRDIDGRKIVLVFNTQEEVDEHMVFAARMGRLPGTEPPVLFGDVAEEFITFLSKKLNQSREERTALIRNYVIAHFAGALLPEVTGAALEAYRDQLYAKLGERTANSAMRELELIMERAVFKKKMEAIHNPFLTLRPRPLALSRNVVARLKLKQRASLPIPTRLQIDCMIESATGWVKLIVCLAFYAGLRGQELRALQWKHVLLDEGLLDINRAIKRWTKELGDPKSGAGNRFVDIKGPLLDLLRSLHPGPGHEEEFVVTVDGAPISYTRLYDSVHRLQVSVGIGVRFLIPGTRHYRYIGTFGPHMLRHACVAQWIWSGKSQADIVREIGHSNVEMTYGVYGHLFDTWEESHPETWPTAAVPPSVDTDDQIKQECELWQ